MARKESHDHLRGSGGIFTDEMTDRLLCGWRLRSAIQLPELAEWHGEDRMPDVEIGLGAVPSWVGGCKIGGGESSDASIEIASDSTTLLDIAGVGRFLVTDGRSVTIEPSHLADAPAIRLYLLGTVLAILSYQRGLLPLHASCLALDSGAVAVAGDSGAGKSTLAATLALRGVTILSDDVCVVDTSLPGGPVAWPTVSRIKLWSDALDRLGIPVTGMEQVRRGVNKYAFCQIPTFRTKPAPLAALYHLTRTAGANEEPFRSVSGIGAVKLLHRSVYRPYIGEAMGRGRDITKALMYILDTVPVFSLSHDPKAAEVSPLPDIILEHQRHHVTPGKEPAVASRATYLDQSVIGEVAQ